MDSHWNWYKNSGRSRELIAVPPLIEAPLRAFAQEHPESARDIEGVLAYRRMVAEEFERLLEING